MPLGRFFVRRSPEERFWKWFAANSERLIYSNSGPLELKRAIDRYDKALSWGIETDDDDYGKCFTFGANGNPDKIPAVQKLVAAAPEMRRWRVRAFYPPKPLAPASVGEMTLYPEDVYFTILEDIAGEKLGVCFYVKGLDRKDPHSPQGEATFRMLCRALGDFDMMTKLAILDFRSLAEVDGNQRPLRDLPPLIAERP
jgi:hypothetical protein